MMSIAELNGIYTGLDIWVIAAGPSAEFVDNKFFEHKLTVGVNFTWKHFATDYVVVKENYALREALEAGQTVVASRWHCGNPAYVENVVTADQRYYIFDHLDNLNESVNLDVIGSDDQLVVSYSTITSAMHLAAYMGAENIILVGHDCGTIDGKVKMDGYYRSEYQQENAEFYRDFISRIEPQTLAVRERLQKVYGCRIYSLNPWVNLGMEGHKYER